MEEIKLTQFSPGAGCGCKISPKDLEEILKQGHTGASFPHLLVGHSTKDDAAVYDIGNGTAIISTTDFFTPIVNDPFDYGYIAAVNAASDIFAMGGKPLMALALLGWPLNKIPGSVAGTVVDGARAACEKIGIPVAGGHSIDISEPIFGLAVTGIAEIKNIKTNAGATPGNVLFLTKKIGTGIITTAEKYNIAAPHHITEVITLMKTFNSFGTICGTLPYVKAMTDVTGFGLLGHLCEICEGSNTNAVVHLKDVPVIEGIEEYIKQEAVPGGTSRNFNSYGHKVAALNDTQKAILCDPQTSGGLLIAVEENSIKDFLDTAKRNNTEVYKIGTIEKKDIKNSLITVC